MRILFWSETFYPNVGGVEVLGTELVRSLHSRGHEVMIVAGPYVPDAGDEQAFHGMPLYRFPFEYQHRPVSPEMILRAKERLAALRQKFRPEIVHLYQIHHGVIYHTAASRRSHRPGTAPTLLTLHGNIFDSTPEVNESRRRLCQRVDWTTACSHALLDEARGHAPEITANSSVIHNALPMPDCEPAPLNFDEPCILYAGRLAPEKRVDIAIDAFARILSRFPRARLLIAGNGTEKANLRAQVEQLGLQSAVEFLGWIAPKAIHEVINRAAVMVVPSSVEPFGLVALQGGQMMRPVIATRVGGLPEVIVDGETGLLVEAENPAAMADALVALLTSPDRARALGRAARRHVQRRFEWTSFVESYESLYARLIAQARTAV